MVALTVLGVILSQNICASVFLCKYTMFCDSVVISNDISSQAINWLRYNKHQIDTLKSQDNRASFIQVTSMYISKCIIAGSMNHTHKHTYSLLLVDPSGGGGSISKHFALLKQKRLHFSNLNLTLMLLRQHGLLSGKTPQGLNCVTVAQRKWKKQKIEILWHLTIYSNQQSI